MSKAEEWSSKGTTRPMWRHRESSSFHEATILEDGFLEIKGMNGRNDFFSPAAVRALIPWLRENYEEPT